MQQGRGRSTIRSMHFALPPAASLARLFGAAPASRPGITRWFAERVPQGTTREIKPPPGRVTVHCRRGEAWLTHDGDPRDVLLAAAESYVADTHRRLTVHSMRGDCVLEFEVAG